MSYPSDPSEPLTLLDDRPLRVWDGFVRLFHWSLVAAVLLDYAVLEEGETPHRWVGYAAAGLVLARCVWGFIGSPHARWSNFLPTPSKLRRQLADIASGEHRAYVGHSPLGAVMMMALMTLVLGLGLTGWLQGTDAYWGEEWLEETHEALASALMLLAAVHAAAALLLGRLERVNLVRAMVTGVKQRQ